jgi:hypothetical protein
MAGRAGRRVPALARTASTERHLEGGLGRDGTAGLTEEDLLQRPDDGGLAAVLLELRGQVADLALKGGDALAVGR